MPVPTDLKPFFASLVEQTFAAVARRVTGGTVVGYGGMEIDLTPPWRRVRMVDLVAEATGEPLDIHADVFPVRVELHDFEHLGETWVFPEAKGWRRGDGNYAWREYDETSDTAYVELTLTATTGEGQAAREKSKQIYIKVKPIPDAPDDS